MKAQGKQERKKVYCGGDHCSGLWNLPCNAPEHPRVEPLQARKDKYGVWEELGIGCDEPDDKESFIKIEHPQKPKEAGWGLLSDCCKAEFDPWGWEKEPGIWQERCLKCGQLCEPVYTELTQEPEPRQGSAQEKAGKLGAEKTIEQFGDTLKWLGSSKPELQERNK